jgi:hypothetical protein
VAGKQATLICISLVLATAGGIARAQDVEGSASVAPTYSSAYSTRPLTLPEGRLRIDVAPPDYGYMDHGELNGGLGASGGRGLRIFIPEDGDAGVGLGIGGAYGIMDELEAGGLIFPFVFVPDFDFGDMELYCKYAFLRGASQLGVQATLRIPTASDFAMGFGMPAQFELGGSTRLDTGVELEMVFADDARINLDLPLAINVNIGRIGFIGGRTGLLFLDFDEMAINLGMQGGAAVHRTVDLTASVNFPLFLWTGPGDAVNPDVEIIAGANIYVDLI